MCVCMLCSAAPAALLDSSLQQLSWALQACQVWELLRDARLLCRHVCLQQVCQMVARTTTPPPAVMQQRQEVSIQESALSCCQTGPPVAAPASC